MIFGGALGDALGGPIEFHKNLLEITSRFGENGIQELERYYHKDMFLEMRRLPAGSVTDDTAMTLLTLEGYNKNIEKNIEPSLDNSLPMIWQAYLKWGSQQTRNEAFAALARHYSDRSIQWSDDIKPFFQTQGAGLSTLAALSKGYYGTPETPIKYYFLVEGVRRVISPNLGCGAMMRTAPIAMLTLHQSDEETFQEACKLAMTTHGHPDSYLSAAVVNHILRGALLNKPFSKNIQNLKSIISNYDGHENCWRVIEGALTEKVDVSEPQRTMIRMDQLPGKLGFSNKFLALPVLAQVIYALRHDGQIHRLYTTRFKDITRLAVNHSGDTDSVGSMCGQYMGAKYGIEYLPFDWMATLRFKDNIRNITNRACSGIAVETMENVRRERENTL